MKKLINDPDDVVRESLEGTALRQPGLALLTDRLVAVRADRVVNDGNRAQVPVALISGGGAGHEPAHAGFVAVGMLTAAVSGGVFSSPSVDAVLDAIRAVTGDAGALLIVKSYTGDRLNFGMAAEVARSEGYAVDMVVVGDDVALADTDTRAGRRGLAGTIFVHKVAGAAAESGRSLAEVAAVARAVATSVATMGVGLTPATVPAVGEPGFEIADDEVELGLGIHGEPGVSREKLTTANELVATMVECIVADRGLARGTRVAILVNSTGGTPPMELDIVSRAAVAEARRHGLEVVRLWAGLVMTSLEMAGASITLLAVDNDLIAALDAPTSARAWPGGPAELPPQLREVAVPDADASSGDAGTPDPLVRAAIDAACRALLNARSTLDEADQHVGDGDLGSALARGAKAWLADSVDGNATHLLRHLSGLARRDVGGTSGPLYGMLLLRAADALDDGADWSQAFRAGVDGVQDLGGAQPGDGTMVDALAPAADAAGEGWDAVVAAAKRGAGATVEAVSSKGRASYLGERAKGYADPGATAVVGWLEAVRDAVSRGTDGRDS